MSTTVNLKNLRLVYAHLVEPRASVPGGEAKYSVTFLVPKDDEDTIAAIKAAAKEAKESKFGTAPVKGLRHPLRDGDEVDAETGELVKRGAEFRGHFYISTTSKNRPPVTITMGGRTVDAPKEHIVSGYYANGTVKFAAYDVSGSKGVSGYINAVHIAKRGEPLGQAAVADTSGADDFAGATGDGDAIPF